MTSRLTVAAQRRQADALRDTAIKVHTKSDRAKILGSDAKPRRKLTPKALEHWWFMLENAPEGQLLMTDIPILEQYCEVIAKLESLTERLGAEPVELINVRGTPVINPYYSVFNTISTLAATLAARLRFIPAMRQLSQAERASQDLKSNPTEQQTPSKRGHLLFGGLRDNVLPFTNEPPEAVE